MNTVNEVLPETLPRWEIPSNWQWVSIADVGKVITGNTPPTKDESNYGNHIPFVKPPALVDGGICSTSEGLSESGAQLSRTLPAGAVLVSCIGGLGKTGITKVPVAFNQQINAVVFDERVVPRYGFYYAQTLKPWLYGVASATTLPIVNKGKFQRAPFPLAPVDQQKRIVAEIEKQFSRLDEAVANLKRVKANLKRYKAAVLKTAVEGRLVETEAELARREGRSYETGDQLLQRILENRRSQWQRKGKYKEPAAPDTTDLPKLPEGWVWAAAEQISDFITKGTTPSAAKLSKGSGEVQFLKVYNLTFDGSLNHTYKPAFVSRKTHEGELARSKVQAGDVLINIVGPPLGQVSVVSSVVAEANINQAIARFRPISPLSPKFLSLALLTEEVMRWAIRRAKTTAGQSNLTLELCRALPIPLPPTAEQGRIVVEVDRRLSLIREVEAQVYANLKRADRMRQSILAHTFSCSLYQHGIGREN